MLFPFQSCPDPISSSLELPVIEGMRRMVAADTPSPDELAVTTQRD